MREPFFAPFASSARTLLCALCLLCVLRSFTSAYTVPSDSLPSPWSGTELHRANTARFAFYMGKRARLAIRLMNLARMYPQRFLDLDVVEYYEKNNVRENSYTLSLIGMMKKGRPLDPLRPSFTLHLAAFYHALHYGMAGQEGHGRFEGRIRWFLNFNRYAGENCAYGDREPDDIVFSLLIDEGVPGYGHRRNILDPDYRRTGIAIQRHREHDYHCVMDLTNGNWIDWLFYRPLFSNRDNKSWK